MNLILLLLAGWCSGAPTTPTTPTTPSTPSTPSTPTSPSRDLPKTANGTDTDSASVSDSHERQERSLPGLYDPPSTPPTHASSPYFADLHGLPAPTPPTLSNELMPPTPSCEDEIGSKCDPEDRYRTFSGWCNNLKNPHAGTPGQIMHLLLPQRHDLPAVFRMKAAGGGLLPNPRHVSLLLQHARRGDQLTVNSVFVQMGQFIDHDFSVTTTVMTPEGGEPDCAPCAKWRDPVCVPIPTPGNDPYQPYQVPGTSERRCLPFIRSIGHLQEDSQGRLTVKQPNFNTAFLDMSPIYGNNACVVKGLRKYSGGKLVSGENYMLTMRPADVFPMCLSDDGNCFYSGDLRVNENPGLAVMHTLFHRAHNNLAEALQKVNPHWDDERLFQETRRINIAQFQNLVYGEYVPTLLGYHTAAKQQLIPNNKDYYLGYDPDKIPGIYNEFSTAALRMGHSQVPRYITLMNDNYQTVYEIPLHYTFFNSTLLYRAGFDPFVWGLLGVPLLPADLNLIEDLAHNLFLEQDKPHSGQDLFALNTARGRDHGLAPYVEYLKLCGIKTVTSFADLESLMPRMTVMLLSRAYTDVRDIDLFPGGLAENPLPGSLVGPTFNCIIGRQFLLLKVGDRHWFEGPAAGFTHAQLQSLRQVTLARVLCDAMDHPDPHVPVHAFHLPHPQSNPVQRCSDLPRVDLELWREAPHSPPEPCTLGGHSYPVGRVVPLSPCLVCVCQPDGKVRCQCDLSGCFKAPRDYLCRRICGHSGPHPHLPPQYRP